MNYTSKNFHLHYIPQYKLFINTDFLEDTLIVTDEADHVMTMFSYPSNEPDVAAVKLLGLPFQHVYVCLPVQSLVFIPTAVYQEEQSDLYKQFLAEDNAARTQTYKFDNLEVTACYQYDMLLFNRWQTIFPNAKFTADFQLLLREVEKYIPMKGEVLGAHFSATQVALYGFKDGKFLFYNAVDILNVDDLNYFVLATCQSFGFQIKLHKVLLSGVRKNHLYGKVLETLAHRLEYIEASRILQVDEEDLKQILAQFNFVTDAPLCVS